MSDRAKRYSDLSPFSVKRRFALAALPPFLLRMAASPSITTPRSAPSARSSSAATTGSSLTRPTVPVPPLASTVSLRPPRLTGTSRGLS